jgi:chromosomal replication initiation ATPase DnaA
MSEKTCEGVWNSIIKIIQDNVPPQSFKTWFEPIKSIKLDNKVLTIQVPSQFFYEWLEEHYVTLLKRALKLKFITKKNNSRKNNKNFVCFDLEMFLKV